jgi:sterol desaturase/sphingolipid hydroxylase (fatty acid hydroxylase superfamily)
MTIISSLWDHIISNYTDHQIFVVGTFLVDNLTFWCLNLLLLTLDELGLFKSLKIQQDKKPNSELYVKCLNHCLFNQFVVVPIGLYVLYPVFTYCGVRVHEPIPHFFIFIRDILVSIAVSDTLSYWSHRLLHHPSIYKYVHKQHHQFRVSVGIASIYAHPIEDVLVNLIPTLGGSLLMGSHIVVMWVWITIRLAETIDVHSGYNFPFSPFSIFSVQGGASRHDFHHSHNVGCYGDFFIFWDHIMGTDIEYIKYTDKLKSS